MKAHINGADLKQSQGKTIVLSGKEYEITLDFNGICELEEKYGSLEKGLNVLSTIESGDFSAAGSMKDVRFLLYVMLKHTAEDITEHEAGKLMTIENMQDIMNSLGTAMKGSFPQPDGTTKKDNSPQEM